MTQVILSLTEKACLLTEDSSHDSNSSIHYPTLQTMTNLRSWGWPSSRLTSYTGGCILRFMQISCRQLYKNRSYLKIDSQILFSRE